MKKVYIMSLLTIFTLLFACYEDKGNYDYKNINRITIKTLEAESGWTGSYGSVLDIKPELIFESGNSDDSHLKYQWDLKGMVREGWDKRDFHWVADTTMSGDLQFSITDELTDVVYTATYYVNINPEFTPSGGGVVILSEKDGNSQLSFISFDLSHNSTTKRTEINSDKIYQNVYEERQKQVLGQGPISIHEHFRRKKGGSINGSQYLILQNSGPIDVVSTTLTKDISLQEAFLGGVYPPSVTSFKQASFMDYTDVLADQDGKLYSRIKAVSDLFHSNYFFLEPLKYEDKVLKNCSLFRSYYYDARLTLIHDKDNKRFLGICDGVASNYDNPGQENSGKILKIPGTPANASDAPEGFIPLDNFGEYELVNGGYYRAASYGFTIGHYMIFKNAKGEYFGQSFVLERLDYYSADVMITEAKVQKLDLPKDPSIVYPTQFLNSGTQDVFIAVDNKLYRFDRLNPSKGAVLHLTFDANIVSISTECYNNYWGVVALENGKVHLIDVVDAKNLSEAEKIIYSLPENVNFGNIKHAIIRSGGNSW